MANEMSEPVRIYLSEFAVLEEARKELFGLLDAFWDELWKETEPQIAALLGAYGHEVKAWSNQSTSGDHMLSSSARREACPIKIQAYYRDPRTSPVPGVGVLLFWCSSADRAAIRRNDAWRTELLKRCAADGVEPVDLNSGEMWTKRIDMNEHDLGKTSAELSGEILRLFRVISSFEQWLIKTAPQAEASRGGE